MTNDLIYTIRKDLNKAAKLLESSRAALRRFPHESASEAGNRAEHALAVIGDVTRLVKEVPDDCLPVKLNVNIPPPLMPGTKVEVTDPRYGAFVGEGPATVVRQVGNMVELTWEDGANLVVQRTHLEEV